jgi:hypothetical protein
MGKTMKAKIRYFSYSLPLTYPLKIKPSLGSFSEPNPPLNLFVRPTISDNENNGNQKGLNLYESYGDIIHGELSARFHASQ